MHFETKAIRLQQARTAAREHSAPIYPTSSYVFDNAEHMRATFASETADNIYSRFTNPNYRELEVKMAALEQTEDAITTATGMAATFASFMPLLSTGDHILLSRAIFGSTYQQALNYLPQWGISATFIDPAQPDTWSAAVQSNTKLIYLETPSNPGLVIIDLDGAAQFAREHGLLLLVDNCFATPYLQQPAKHGADLVIHSATKFIDGQGRVLGGIVCGPQKLIDEIRKFCRNTGPAISPFNAWIISKSLETLHVRMDRHCENALFLAQQLTSHSQVQVVNYPFLPSHAGYEIARKQMRAGGGIITFEVKGGLAKGRDFLDRLQLISLSANLGDTRTIATHPASTTHAKLTEEARAEIGITNGLIRLSVGLENREDILTDVVQALG
jgi:O-succinylhomoserine sulfhydrylase